MGKVQELYDARVRPMVPAERLQLARLILDDLAPDETVPDADGAVARINTPRLADPTRAVDFAKHVSAADAPLMSRTITIRRHPLPW